MVALYDFEGRRGDELSFRQGDLITLRSRPDDTGWGFGVLMDGETEGLFPWDFVQVGGL